MPVYKKETTLEGFWATGDYECFCFGKQKEPREVYDYLDKVAPQPVVPDDYWDLDNPNEKYPEVQAAWDKRDAEEAKIQVYPGSLLPDVWGEVTPYGRWKITVEFEPLPPPVPPLAEAETIDLEVD